MKEGLPLHSGTTAKQTSRSTLTSPNNTKTKSPQKPTIGLNQVPPSLVQTRFSLDLELTRDQLSLAPTTLLAVLSNKIGSLTLSISENPQSLQQLQPLTEGPLR